MSVNNALYDKRILRKFSNKFIIDNETGCWNWIASKNKAGYGRIGVYPNSCELAHRVSWVIHKGPLPEFNRHTESLVCHSCDNRACVNPNHLFLGTNNDNQRDAMQKGRLKGIPRNRPLGIKKPKKIMDDYKHDLVILRDEGFTFKKLAWLYRTNTTTIRNAINDQRAS